MTKKLIPFAFCILLLQLICNAGNNAHEVPDSSAQNAQRARTIAEKLNQIQIKSNLLWRRAGWWNNANILEAMIDYKSRTKEDPGLFLKKIYKRNVILFRGHFITHHAFDDNEWWALTWLKAFDVTGHSNYLKTARDIFKDLIKRSWDNHCGGGLRWAVNGEYKNAVTNELFMELAARLALESTDTVQRAYYKQWAIKDWLWFKNSGMINKSLMINDGLNTQCMNNGGTTWTYNQGVLLGALKDIFLLTGDSTYLQQAASMATASMKYLSSPEGVLTEPGNQKPDPDKTQFKGIYIRYLAMLNIVLKDSAIKKFIQLNADYVWQHARGPDNFIDFNWGGPYRDWQGSSQGSALDLFNGTLPAQ